MSESMKPKSLESPPRFKRGDVVYLSDDLDEAFYEALTPRIMRHVAYQVFLADEKNDTVWIGRSDATQEEIDTFLKEFDLGLDPMTRDRVHELKSYTLVSKH